MNMEHLFLLIGIILGGIIDRYIMPVLDLTLQKFANNKQLQAQKKQREISSVENEIELEALDTKYEGMLIQKDILDIQGQMQKQDTNAIGYQMGESLEYPEDWDEEEDLKSPSSESKYRDRIGF
jgi:hypothetical protein